jgi:hypothetical protein
MHRVTDPDRDKATIQVRYLIPYGDKIYMRSMSCYFFNNLHRKVLIVLPDLPLYPKSGKENIHPHSSALICG